MISAIFRLLGFLLVLSLLCVPCAQGADEDWLLQTIPAITAARVTPTGPLPDTGVTLCFDDTTNITCPSEGQPFYGQDAQYNPPERQHSYTDNSDGTVTDNVTGLMWMQSDDNTTRAWQAAYEYCRDSEASGYEDWRLPTNYELQNIVDWSKNQPLPAIDPIFTGCKFEKYWSSTPRGQYPDDKAWCTDFDIGDASERNKVTNSYYVRCVRGETTTQRFRSISGTEVYDTVTGLTWQRTDDNLTYTWEEALEFCENYKTGGHEDWRLPNIVELYSILDLTQWEPSIDTTVFAVQPTQYPIFWSSTTGAGGYGTAWRISFEKGETYVSGKATEQYVRCVRGGQ